MQEVLNFAMFFLLVTLVPAVIFFLAAAIDKYRNK